jgi:hypothetical protein
MSGRVKWRDVGDARERLIARGEWEVYISCSRTWWRSNIELVL